MYFAASVSPTTLLLVPSSFRSLKVDGAVVKILGPGQGASYIAKMIRRGAIRITDFAVVFVCTGRNDLDIDFKEPVNGAADLIATLQRFHPKVIAFFSGPVPRHNDPRSMVAKCVNAGRGLESLTDQHHETFYSKFAEEFYTKQGVKSSMFGKLGITRQPIMFITAHIENRVQLLKDRKLI